MANNTVRVSLPPRLAGLVSAYVAVVLGTIAALALLSATDPEQATSDAWVHAAIVALFGILLPLRLRSARHGSRRSLRAVVVIATVLLVVNVVEAVLPGLFPTWMRIEMIGTAALMAAIAVAGVRARR